MARIAVIIASLGRPDVLSEHVTRLLRQTRPPDRIIVCVTTPEDAPIADSGPSVQVIISPKGSCPQRNAGLREIGDDADLIAFFDDDFVECADYLERLETFFSMHPEISGASGLVLRDGVTGPGLTFTDADEAIEAHIPTSVQSAAKAPCNSLYGANMIFRAAAVDGVEFDENLPLYGWLEDVDFSARAGEWGPLVNTDAFFGVHLGAKGGRTSGIRFGYSQIVNPLYLRRKGTITLPHAAHNVGRNLLANHLKALRPEPYIDRWGRVKGNWLGIKDIVFGKADPARILSL